MKNFFKNKKKESVKKQKIKDLTKLVESNSDQYDSKLNIYKNHIDDIQLLLDNISNDYNQIIDDNSKLRGEILKKNNDIFELKKEMREKLDKNFKEVQNFKFLLKEQIRIINEEKSKKNHFNKLYKKYHFMNTLLNSKD